MSAILKTLKKLEEEKSVLEQNLDIEEMVTQGEMAPPPSFMRSRKTGTAAVFLGLAMAVLAAYFVYKSNGPEPRAVPAASAPVVKRPPVPQTAPPPRAKPSASGIPLARIPATKKAAAGPAGQTPPADKQSPPPAALPAAPKEVPLALKKNVPPLVPLSEIHTLIESAKRAADRAAGQPPKIKPRRNDVYIPGLKIKGIVFLAAGSSINHILVSTPGINNLKMRVGEDVLGATLKSIQSDKAIFLYKGRITETGIGE